MIQRWYKAVDRWCRINYLSLRLWYYKWELKQLDKALVDLEVEAMYMDFSSDEDRMFWLCALRSYGLSVALPYIGRLITDEGGKQYLEAILSIGIRKDLWLSNKLHITCQDGYPVSDLPLTSTELEKRIYTSKLMYFADRWDANKYIRLWEDSEYLQHLISKAETRRLMLQSGILPHKPTAP